MLNAKTMNALAKPGLIKPLARGRAKAPAIADRDWIPEDKGGMEYAVRSRALNPKTGRMQDYRRRAPVKPQSSALQGALRRKLSTREEAIWKR